MSRERLLDQRNFTDAAADVLSKLSTDELWEEMASFNKELARFGVTEPISIIVWSGQVHGCKYEDVHSHPGSSAKATPLNCFMALLHSQPELRKLPTEDFEELAGVVAMVSQATDILLERNKEFEWPRKFQKPPR